MQGHNISKILKYCIFFWKYNCYESSWILHNLSELDDFILTKVSPVNTNFVLRNRKSYNLCGITIVSAHKNCHSSTLDIRRNRFRYRFSLISVCYTRLMYFSLWEKYALLSDKSILTRHQHVISYVLVEWERFYANFIKLNSVIHVIFLTDRHKIFYSTL